MKGGRFACSQITNSMNKIIQLKQTTPEALMAEINAYIKKGYKSLGGYIEEDAEDHTIPVKSKFLFCKNMEAPRETIVAEIASPSKTQFDYKSKASKNEAKSQLRSITAGTNGWFDSSDMVECLVAALGWNSSQQLRNFVSQTLTNWSDQGILLKEPRSSRNLYRKKQS